MNEKPPDVLPLVKQWIAMAEEDFRNADYTLTMPRDCPCSTVCFHAQQAVEKYLKALLLLRSIPFPRSHDIGELVGPLPASVPFPLTPEEQQRLTDYAVVTRYPGEWEPIDRAEAMEAVHLARQARAALQSALPGSPAR